MQRLPVAAGGTGASSLTGYVKGNGSSAFTASPTIPATDLSGIVPTARLGSGSADASKFLRGDSTWASTLVGASAAYAGGSTGIFKVSTGTGTDNDEQVRVGVVDGSYSWVQALKLGTAYRGLVLQPSGGNVGIGTDPTNVPSTGNPVVGGAGNLILYNAGDLGLTMLTDNAATRTQQMGFGSQGISLFDAGLKWDNNARRLDLWAGSAQKACLDVNGNFGVGTTAFGTSAAGVLGLKNGTAPTTGPADTVQIYSSDDAAGHTIPSFYCEGTNVVATGQPDSASSVRVKMRINGVVRTFLCI